MEELRKQLLAKLKKEQRGIKWFHANYVEAPGNPSYTTTYHQITGYIETIPDNLCKAIKKYVSDK
jgi:hypothetical protein